MKASTQPRIFYGWVIVLVSFLTMLLVMGTRLSFGVFYSSMLAEMGWSRAATAGIFSRLDAGLCCGGLRSRGGL